jgi:hypothetical protein
LQQAVGQAQRLITEETVDLLRKILVGDNFELLIYFTSKN